MGIDFSHCDAHWAYSGFARFRKRIADEIGFPDYDSVSDTNDPRFAAIKKDPLVFLLAHSDCDGHLTAKQCQKLAPRLREIVSKWPDDDNDKGRALELCDGMKLAAKQNKKLEFR